MCAMWLSKVNEIEEKCGGGEYGWPGRDSRAINPESSLQLVAFVKTNPSSYGKERQAFVAPNM